MLEVVNSPQYRELSPKQIVPQLADKSEYLASESTIYRILRSEGQMHPRGRSKAPRRRPKALTATGPNEVWSWDITYLKSGTRGAFFYLYMFIDIWSRKIVGWEVHDHESPELSSTLVRQIMADEAVDGGKLALHSDNGGPMKGATMKATLDKLGITPSLSRPHVSNDNPFSESLFRTLKYRPEYPKDPFNTLAEARAWVASFVAWYNTEHQHSAIQFVTPDQRHSGAEHHILQQRRRVYDEARQRNPARWSGPTRSWTPTQEVTLNPERRPIDLLAQDLQRAA